MIWRKAIVFTCVAVFVCFAVSAYAADPVSVNSITLDQTEVTVAVGKAVTLKSTIEPKNATVKKLEWTSSDEAIATVSNNGNIKGVAPGTAVITAKSTDDSGALSTASVTVIQEVKKITAESNKVSLAPDTTWQLEVAIEPADATIQEVAWSSSNEKVATVDENGLVTGIKKGSCKITASATDGSKKKLDFSVQVKEYDIVITKPGVVETDFETTNDYGVFEVGFMNMVKATVVERNVTYKGDVVAEAGERKIRPIKPGEGSIESVSKENGRVTEKFKKSVFVASSIIEKDEDIRRIDAKVYNGRT